MLENVGVAGQAFRQAQLNPDAPQLFAGSRTTQNHDAFLKQMVTDYGFSQDDALNLSQSTMSWLAFAIARNGTVYGVLYCDSKQADFFTDERKEDLLHAMVGIAYFVGLRYP
jgi:putative methionine-R-sulfoxide reductase with GAF domain